MYTLKEKPEEFVVEEITDIGSKERGQYSLWWMTKKDRNTMDAIAKIAKVLHLKDRFIGFAGTKDKKAITKQLISIRFTNKERIERLEFDDIKLEYYGRSEDPLSLGDLEGNRFEIVVRNLDEQPNIEAKKVKNYFGEQRFSKNNAEIGKNIVKKEYKEAAELIDESDERYGIKEFLQKNPTDTVGALRKVPIKILRIYVHAYQSLLWNKIAEKVEDIEELPIIGFSTEVKDGDVKKIMEEEEITSRSFIIREMPELSSQGDMRKLYVNPKGFEILEKGKDELNEGKYKIKIKFELPKGSYATEVIRQLLI